MAELAAPLRRACAAAAFVMVAGAIAGSVWGQDDHWPFAPFRMYSTTTPPSGSVFIPVFIGRTRAGDHVRITPSGVGMRRAEVLGQIRRIRADAHALQVYADAYARLHPDAAPLASLSLVYEIQHLRNGAPARFETRTIASWPGL
jgi:hypothetical protein